MNKMKAITASLILLITCEFTSAQSNRLVGDWKGKLEVSGMELRIVFHIETNDVGDLSATMDSPDQGAYGIECGEVKIDGDTITIMVPRIGGQYQGSFANPELIQGTWSQGPANLELDLLYTEEIEELNRPQEPKPPFPYQTMDVQIPNSQAGVTLAGTLTIPRGNGPFPAAVLVSGSGPQDRDESIMGHKPFLVLSDYLTRNGIAVLRYDDRGVGASTGDFARATSLDHASDAEAALLFLRDQNNIDRRRSGIIGHSEGGLIAPIVAAKSKDIGFIVLLAGPGINGAEIIIRQSRLIAEVSGIPADIIERQEEWQTRAFKVISSELDSIGQRHEIEKFADDYVNALPEEEQNIPENSREAVLERLSGFNSPWMRYFLTYDPATSLEKVKCPVLALNGEKDLQVPSEVNLEEIEKALKKAKNKNFKVLELPGLNHLFQHSDTGAPSEYAKIEETFAEDAMMIITEWIGELK